MLNGNSQENLSALGNIFQSEERYICEGIIRLKKERKAKGKRELFGSREEFYQAYLKLCHDGGLEPLSESEALLKYNRNDIYAQGADVAPNTPQSQPTENPAEIVNIAEARDLTPEIIEKAKQELAKEKAQLRKAASGMSLYSSYITAEAANLLGLSAKQKLYVHLAGNVDLASGKTRPQSRENLAETIGSGKRHWYRIEKQLHDSGLIQYHEDDNKLWKSKVSFILPQVADYYNNVQRKKQ